MFWSSDYLANGGMSGSALLPCFLMTFAMAAIVFVSLKASMASDEGGAGGAVRMILTLAAPATFLGLMKAFGWPLEMVLALSLTWIQYRRSQSGISDIETCGRVAEFFNRLSTPLKFAAIVLLAQMAIDCALAVASPAYGGDAIVYHLPMSVAFLQQRGFIPARIIFFPGLSELLEAIGIGATHSVGGKVFAEAVVAVALLLAVYGFVRRQGGTRETAAAAAIGVSCLRLPFCYPFTSKNDLLVGALLVAGCALWGKKPLLCACAFGMAAAVKYTALSLGFAVGAVMAITGGWNFAPAGWLILCGLALPWYVRNYLETGTPVIAGALDPFHMGFPSSIAAQFPKAPVFSLLAMAAYGGLLPLAGLLVLLSRFFSINISPVPRTLKWLCLAAFLGWIATPGSGGFVPGSMEILGHGFTLRYALALLTFLSSAAVIALEPAANGKLVGWLVLISSLWGGVRAFHLIWRVDPDAARFSAPILAAALSMGLGIVLIKKQEIAAKALAVTGLVLFSAAAAVGFDRIARRWEKAYAPIVEPITSPNQTTDILSNPRFAASRRIALIGVESILPFAGPNLDRKIFLNIIPRPAGAWVHSLSALHLDLIIAAVRKHPYEQTQAEEEAVARSGSMKLVYADENLRAYAPRNR